MNTLYYNQFSSHNKHLSLNERIIIERMVGLKKSTLDIALTLGKSQRTIQREIKRGKTTIRNNLWEDVDVYAPIVAQDKYNVNIKNKGKTPKILSDEKLLKHIVKMYTTNKYSPEAIVGDIKNRSLSFEVHVSSNIIRYYIKNNIIDIKYNKKITSKQPPRISKKIPVDKSIDFRPKHINEREEVGHWEGDLVVGSNKKGKALFTMVERKTRKCIIRLSLIYFQPLGKTGF